MDENMNIEYILEVLKKNLGFILMLTVLFGIIVLIFTLFLLTPKYEAHTQILVSQSENSSPSSNVDIETSLQLINTYGDIIESPIVLNDVIDNLNLDESTEGLAEKITVFTQEASQVINITVTDEAQRDAAIIANELSGVFQDKITEVMSVDNVSVLAPATIESGSDPVSPRPLLNTFIAMILGASIGIIIAFLRAYFDKSIKTAEEVEKYLELPVLGITTKFEK